jgi:pentatricopeptide repeat protein
MKQKHCEPDAYTYTILIRMYGKAGKTSKFLSILEEMVSKACVLNLIAYNTVIEALGKNKMIDKVIFMLSKMIESGCQPNQFTYSIILDVLATEKQLQKLDEVLDICSGYLNRSIYSFLIKSLCKSGHASEAHNMFCRMWSSHETADRDAFVSMLEMLCNAEKNIRSY